MFAQMQRYAVIMGGKCLPISLILVPRRDSLKGSKNQKCGRQVCDDCEKVGKTSIIFTSSSNNLGQSIAIFLRV
jgi:hypothetical protein